jgi:hypothetical protein
VEGWEEFPQNLGATKMTGEENRGAYERAAMALERLRHMPALEARQLACTLFDVLERDAAGSGAAMAAATRRAEELIRASGG